MMENDVAYAIIKALVRSKAKKHFEALRAEALGAGITYTALRGLVHRVFYEIIEESFSNRGDKKE